MMSAVGEKLVFRVDAGAEIGIGHAMRCLALAEAWADAGGACTFIMSSYPGAGLAARLAAEKIDLRVIGDAPGSASDAVNTIELAVQANAGWIVVDGYAFAREYCSVITDAGHKVMLIDDYGSANSCSPTIILNQNAYAAPSLYPDASNRVGLLLGLDYVLLRREFARWDAWTRDVAKRATHVLITLGGADAANVTTMAITGLMQLRSMDLDVVVVLGPGNRSRQLVEAIIDADTRFKIVYDSSDMPQLMSSADIAISAAGSTCYEAARLGLPALAITVAENQVAVAKELADKGVVCDMGWYSQLSPDSIASAVSALASDYELRSRMAQRGQRLVPGGGSSRVVRSMLRPGAFKVTEKRA